jgi:hypothetical protein
VFRFSTFLYTRYYTYCTIQYSYENGRTAANGVGRRPNDFPAKRASHHVEVQFYTRYTRAAILQTSKTSSRLPAVPPMRLASGQIRSGASCTTSAPWDDPQGALDKYLAEKYALHAGRRPREANDGVTVKVLVNTYLNSKRTKLDSGELSPLTLKNCKDATDLIVASLGKTRLAADIGPDDLGELRAAMAKEWGPVRVRDMIQRVRSAFKYGLDCDLLDRPARFGPDFARPSRKNYPSAKDQARTQALYR